MLGIRLTPTSYIVLGLLDVAGSATPYELKQGVAGSIGNFWSVPHSQLYAEPERLAKAGLVVEQRETGGRRRRRYSLTAAGREALRAWREDPVASLPELRNTALLKLFFGADPAAVAREQIDQHRAKLAEYEALHRTLSGQPGTEGPVLTLEAGIEHERVWVAYWERLAGG